MNNAALATLLSAVSLGGAVPNGMGFYISTKRPARVYQHKTHEQIMALCIPHDGKTYQHRFTGQIRTVSVDERGIWVMQSSPTKKLFLMRHRVFLRWVRHAL